MIHVSVYDPSHCKVTRLFEVNALCHMSMIGLSQGVKRYLSTSICACTDHDAILATSHGFVEVMLLYQGSRHIIRTSRSNDKSIIGNESVDDKLL